MVALREHLKWFTFTLVFAFFLSALLFCTSMLSTSTIIKTTGNTTCEGVEPVDQVVVLLIDALRPDFALSALRAYTREEGGCGVVKSRREREEAYGGGTLNYMEHSLRNESDASHSYILVADAPTTTAQRIKAIATGAMPAFLEAGSNFNSDAVETDSVIRQVGGRAVVLGDDTWVKLFPHKKENGKDIHWKKSIVLPSFDVADFHSNDNTVLDIIYDELTRETKEKDADDYAKLIIGHFLGVDHVGHRINAENNEMNAKLEQLNHMLYNVSRTLSERKTNMRTVLLVFGDHGMTSSGDHGGDSALETDTFLFAKLFDPNEKQLSPTEKTTLCALNEERWGQAVDPELQRLQTCRTASQADRCKLGATYQVDITPTIAVLLGKPIPFSSLGRLLPEVLYLADPNADLEKLEACNLRQIDQYMQSAGVHDPTHPSWSQANTAREQVARKSFYMRRTGTDMNLKGMFVGCLLLLVLAESIVFFPEVRWCFRPTFFGAATLFVLFLRLCLTFSNSFAINEDTEVLSMLSFLAIALLLATTGATTKNISFVRVTLVSFLVVSRLCQFSLLRYREHITHNVSSGSLLDKWITSDSLYTERIGVVVSSLLTFFLYRHTLGRVNRLCILLHGVLLCVLYKCPLWHHIPTALFIVWFALPSSADRKRSASIYFVLVAWCCSLCNEKIFPSLVIATYGNYLPLFIAALRGLPLFTQALMIHLLSYGAFFLEGHQSMLNTIDWNSSFVGVPFYNIVFGGVLVLSRTFNAFLLVPLAVRVTALLHGGTTKQEVDTLGHLILHLCVANGATSCFNGYIQKNHLMLYPIFCPKLLFDVVITLMSGVGFCASIFLWRIK
ncbi:phosphatidylinositol glycan, class O [Angomonas deanei]|uniref:Type I phosphodiesterase / nucleotide pyrophosphatase, putative n=1 Tax=Angomonas deanei TaxID=59799 RepID=A0A7G2CLZ9_9TRYP|nr:phosphatidylinositol glycan, class O [Angomonas deanei]CAD2219951.1 Type I phosphodiesterase / nucleotide pyrophosphatase, putative [Angomonas deanei]|eukprot:EPY37336.1 phosphatidylinositol glycan, class O [Angomonas deanei]